jgi:CheY-like chemotaxis protein
MSDPKNRHVLIVDDNPEIHEDFRKVLGGRAQDAVLEQMEAAFFGQAAAAVEGYELDSAHQGEEALAKVRARMERGEHYALAFVDMRMPPGWELLVGGDPGAPGAERPAAHPQEAVRHRGGVPARLRADGEMAPGPPGAPQARAAAQHGRRADARA